MSTRPREGAGARRSVCSVEKTMLAGERTTCTAIWAVFPCPRNFADEHHVRVMGAEWRGRPASERSGPAFLVDLDLVDCP